MAFAREIVESHVAERLVDEEIRANPEFSDFYDGLKWRLAREPDIGYPVPKTNPQTYVIHSYHWSVAAIVIAYRFDENQVEILNLRIIPHRA
jgi:hypothetical protein